jgi:hypothetical protein
MDTLLLPSKGLNIIYEMKHPIIKLKHGKLFDALGFKRFKLST